MTLVRVDLRHRTGSGDAAVAGHLTIAPATRQHADVPDGSPDDYVRTREPYNALLSEGVATLDLPPTASGTGWWITECIPHGVRRLVSIPDVEQVDYGDLPDLDPATLDPAASPEAAWTLALSALADRVATLEAEPKLVPVLEEGEPVPAGTVSGDLIYRPDPVAVFELVEETATTFESPASDNITLAVPSGVEVGDTLVAVVTWQTDSDDVVAPAGWEPLTGPLANQDYRSTSVYSYKVAAVPSADQVFSLAGGGRADGVMVRVTGVDVDDPLLVVGGESTRDTNTVTVPATPGSAGGLIISVTSGQATSGQEPYPLVFSNGLVPFVELQSSPDGGVTRTWLAVAWGIADVDFPEHTVATAGAISSAASLVGALREAS